MPLTPAELAAVQDVLRSTANTDALVDDATSDGAPVQKLAESAEDRAKRRQAALEQAIAGYGAQLKQLCEGSPDGLRFNAAVRRACTAYP